jgi:hypothetical protein
MASFCSGCGFPLAANVAFCPNCGARTQAAASSAPAPSPVRQPAPAPAAPAKSGSGLTVLLVIVGVLAVVGVAAVAGVWYVGHRVKEAVVEKAKAYGVELPTDLPAHTSAAPVRLPKTCDLLSKEDAATLLGEPIERTEQQSEACLYYGPAGLSAKLADQQAAGFTKSMQTPGANGENMQAALHQMATTMGAGEEINGNGAELPLLILAVDPDGAAQMTALTASKALFQGIFDASGAKGLNISTEIPGLGDRAIRMPKMGLNVLKGGVLLRIMPGPLPDADAKTIAVARAALKKL